MALKLLHQIIFVVCVLSTFLVAFRLDGMNNYLPIISNIFAVKYVIHPLKFILHEPT